MHMIIKKYSLNGKTHRTFRENFKCDNLSLEIVFKSISSNIIYDLNKVLEDYQIKVVKFIDESYAKKFFDNNIEISEMSHKILRGCNENEVIFVPKNTKKHGFFEKFFQLFS